MGERAADDVCGFCLEPWADHTEGERASCLLDLEAMERREIETEGDGSEPTDDELAGLAGWFRGDDELPKLHPVGVRYCVHHHGIADEDEDRCDFAYSAADDGPVDEDGAPICDFRELVYVDEDQPTRGARASSECPDPTGQPGTTEPTAVSRSDVSRGRGTDLRHQVGPDIAAW